MRRPTEKQYQSPRPGFLTSSMGRSMPEREVLLRRLGCREFRWPGMPEGTHMNLRVRPQRAAHELWIGFEYAKDPVWMSAGYGGEITFGCLGWQIRAWWWPTDPEGVL